MSRTVVASQMPSHLNALIARAIPEVEIVPLDSRTLHVLPSAAQILLSTPFVRPGEDDPPPPPGWPFDLRWVQLQSAGIDHYPEWLFDGPVVTSAAGATAGAIAEYVFAAILSDAKHMPSVFIHGPEQWVKTTSTELTGQVLGVLGFGAIGEALAPRARAFGMSVLATRRSDRPIPVEGVERVSDIHALVERSDVLVIAAPSTPETRHILNAEVLRRAKPGLHVINVARGALVDDDALLHALDVDQVRLATLDVCTPEPPPAGHPYYTHPRVRLSPHTSAITAASRDKLAARFAANFERFRAGAPLEGVVDFRRGY